MAILETLNKGFKRIGAARLGLLVTVTILFALYPAIPSLAQPYQGFGANTPGGAGQPIYHVTNLNDSGPGSLRDAVSQGNRTVVFDVAGEIVLSSEIYVKGAFITIDGFSAPSPVILVNDGLRIVGNIGAHDIIVRAYGCGMLSGIASRSVTGRIMWSSTISPLKGRLMGA